MSLERFFRPKHVAVVGASADPTKIAGRVLVNLRNTRTPPIVSAINPKYDEISGTRCYPDVASVPGDIDVAIVVVPAERTPDVMRQIGARGIPFAMLFSGGFAETGAAGVALQAEVAAIARRYGVRIYGPNTNGFFDIAAGFGYTFSAKFDPAEFVVGDIGLVVQGGGMGRAVLDAMGFGVGFSVFASTGNEADLEIADFIGELVDDPRTRVIAVIVEGLIDSGPFIHAAKRAFAAGKPVVVLKIGRNELGNRSAQSHTGKLAADFALYQGIFAQCGVTMVDDLPDLLAVAWAFSRVPHRPGLRVGLLTYSGGTAVLAADACGEFGLALPPLSASSIASLRATFPAFALLENPADLTTIVVDQPPLFADAIRVFAGDPAFDVVVAIVAIPTLGAATVQLAEQFVRTTEGAAKPIVPLWLSLGRRDRSFEILAERGVVFTDVRTPLAALAAVQEYARLRELRTGRPAVPTPPAGALAAHRGANEEGERSRTLSEHESKNFLRPYGLRATREVRVTTLAGAKAAAAEIGYPVALKIDAATMPHKSEHGAIRLNLANESVLEEAYGELSAIGERQLGRNAFGLLVQEMIAGGMELVVGARRDPIFGPMVMAGLGGVFVEVLRDVQFRSAPLTVAEAHDMLDALRAAPILHGHRGAGIDGGAIAELICRVGTVMIENPDLRELDLNPVFAFAPGHGYCVADALLSFDAARAALVS